MNHRHVVSLAVGCSLFLTTVQVAADKPQSTSPVVPVASLDRTRPPDMDLRRTRVSRDPATGQIEISPGPATRTWSLSPREQNMLNRSDEGLEPTVLANGAVTVNLKGRFQSMVTGRTPSGNSLLEMSCSIDDGAAPSTD
jgi:hypothetical protein